MEEVTAFLARNEKGNLKLDYMIDGQNRIRVWEAKKDSILETTLDGEGAILMQKLLEKVENMPEYRIKETLDEAKIEKTQETDYTPIKINKSCPKCNEYKLVRYVEAFSSKEQIPVMPIYHCSNCSTKSYYLTNTYLEYLIDNNSNLFETAELSALQKDRSAFVSELKEYIIRIFASQKVLCIK